MTEPRKGGFDLKDYVTVAERLVAFYDKYPDGSIQTDIIELSPALVVMRATVYRTANDERPSVAHSSLNIPGATPYTRGSEIENAETSAVGRAIAMLGFEVKRGMASREEVENKQGEDSPEPERHADGLVGTVAKGKRPVDLELRETPDGHAWGFKLQSGRKGYQALAQGKLAEDLWFAATGSDVAFEGQRVQVWGRIEMVPWDKDGKDMPPFARIAIERVQTDEWTLPREEAPSESLGLLTDEDKAAIGGGMPG